MLILILTFITSYRKVFIYHNYYDTLIESNHQNKNIDDDI